MKISSFLVTSIAAASALAPSSDTKIKSSLRSSSNFYDYNTAPFGGSKEESVPEPPLGPTLNGWTPDAKKPCFGLPGAIPPLGYFDPMGFCKNRNLVGVKRFREAEIIHGRIAMLASFGFLASENLPTLTYGINPAPIAIHQVPDVPLFGVLFPVFLIVNVSEALRANRGWVDPATGQLFSLRESYYPGDLEFDPLGIKPRDGAKFADIQNKELANGRLAMIAVAGMCVQELVNGKPVLEALNDVLGMV